MFTTPHYALRLCTPCKERTEISQFQTFYIRYQRLSGIVMALQLHYVFEQNGWLQS